jgi:hypothetical protein
MLFAGSIGGCAGAGGAAKPRAADQYPITDPYSTARAMNPSTQASPISVLLGLGLLVGRLSLIETCVMGAMGVVRMGVGSVIEISRGSEKNFRSLVEMVMALDFS